MILLTLSLVGCGKPDSAEIAIEQNITQMQSAIENKDPDALLDLLHENFATKTGLDTLRVKRTMVLYMLRHENIHTLITNLQIESKSDLSATASFNALVSGGTGLLPDQGALYQVETDWRLDDNEWLLIYANWNKR
jgi:hypothetical protein